QIINSPGLSPTFKPCGSRFQLLKATMKDDLIHTGKSEQKFRHTVINGITSDSYIGNAWRFHESLPWMLPITNSS
ncbi:hypothetical protein CEXT_36771, partial [Caerostris extrusa]